MAEATRAAYSRAALPTVTVASERARPAIRLIALLTLGHVITHVNQGSLPIGSAAARFLPLPRSS